MEPKEQLSRLRPLLAASYSLPTRPNNNCSSNSPHLYHNSLQARSLKILIVMISRDKISWIINHLIWCCQHLIKVDRIRLRPRIAVNRGNTVSSHRINRLRYLKDLAKKSNSVSWAIKQRQPKTVHLQCQPHQIRNTCYNRWISLLHWLNQRTITTITSQAVVSCFWKVVEVRY